MPKTIFNLLNPFSIKKQYNAVNKYAYSENVNYINPPDGQIKPMPGMENVISYPSSDTTNVFNKVGDIIPLQEEDAYVFVGNNRIYRIDLKRGRISYVELDTYLPDGKTTCATDGENVYIPTVGSPKWLGKNLVEKFWQSGAPATDLSDYYLRDAVIDIPSTLSPKLILKKYHFGDWRVTRNPTTTNVDPNNGSVNVNTGSHFIQDMQTFIENLGLGTAERALNQQGFASKELITLPVRQKGDLGFFKYWFGFSLIYDEYQESSIQPLRIFPEIANTYHFVESVDSDLNQLHDGETINVDYYIETGDEREDNRESNRRVQVGRDANTQGNITIYYTGWGPYPLEKILITDEGIDWISGSGADGLELELNFENSNLIPDRVTGCRIYVRHTATELIDDEEQGTGDWFLVQTCRFAKTPITGESRQTSFNANVFPAIKKEEMNWWQIQNNTEIGLGFDYMKIHYGRYTQQTGLTSEYNSMDVRYKLCASVAGHLVVADVSYPDGLGGRVSSERELLISEYDRFSIFDYAFKKLRIKHKPTAIIEYRGDMLVFEEGHTYLIDINTFQIREEWEGIGASSPASVAVTDRGIFFANKKNVYAGGQGRIEAIGNEIWDIAEYPQNGYKEQVFNVKQTIFPTVAYNAEFDCVLVMWTRSLDNRAIGAMYYPQVNDWVTHIVLPGIAYAYKLFTSYKGENYLLTAGRSTFGHEIFHLFSNLNELLDMQVEAKLSQIGNLRFKFYELTIDTQNPSAGTSGIGLEIPSRQTPVGPTIYCPYQVNLDENSLRELNTIDLSIVNIVDADDLPESISMNINIDGSNLAYRGVSRFSTEVGMFLSPDKDVDGQTNQTLRHYLPGGNQRLWATIDSNTLPDTYLVTFSTSNDSSLPAQLRGLSCEMRVGVQDLSHRVRTIVAGMKGENRNQYAMRPDRHENNQKRLVFVVDQNPQVNPTYDPKEWYTDVQFFIQAISPRSDLSIKNIYAIVRPEQVIQRTINV